MRKEKRHLTAVVENAKFRYKYHRAILKEHLKQKLKESIQIYQLTKETFKGLN